VLPALLACVLTAPAVAGCSSAGGAAPAAVPSPDAATSALCAKLHQKLPHTVDSLKRREVTPHSVLTAAWGDPAIVLRCGVPRPAKMNDENAEGVEVDGVGWLDEQRSDGSYRFTTTLRKAYVEVDLPKQRTARGLAPLTDLAAPVKKTIPEGIAD
jgi:hypothetical protein